MAFTKGSWKEPSLKLTHSAKLATIIGLVIAAAAGPIPAATASPLASAVTAIAPGCDTAHPTFVGGAIYGSDGGSLNALIGVDHLDANDVKVNADGVPVTGAYSWTQGVNPSFPPQGNADQTGTRTWGRCITAKVREIFVEIYPKDPTGTTNHTRYGGAAHYRQPVTVGGDNNGILLRLPVTFEADGGNTGSVNGYITYRGHQVPTQYLTRVRAFTTGSGPDCGIEGFKPAATALGPSGSMDATYYRISYLAGGRCGATSQRYSLYVDCTSFCGASTRTLQRYVDITKGTRPRVDFAF
jgi:hypothetical protein